MHLRLFLKHIVMTGHRFSDQINDSHPGQLLLRNLNGETAGHSLDEERVLTGARAGPVSHLHHRPDTSVASTAMILAMSAEKCVGDAPLVAGVARGEVLDGDDQKKDLC